ncbi:hypothetical protein F0562_032174 [Nyssa sinensis]|uniref:Uncharacterized protein n=1 Tax=Nyssa sinensis TaxID=561372 RepID=A0A5J5AYU2_9ASTE|nr:hypothetical protein F0562_032174 [Nyssa sinensis]
MFSPSQWRVQLSQKEVEVGNSLLSAFPYLDHYVSNASASQSDPTFEKGGVQDAAQSKASLFTVIASNNADIQADILAGGHTHAMSPNGARGMSQQLNPLLGLPHNQAAIPTGTRPIANHVGPRTPILSHYASTIGTRGSMSHSSFQQVTPTAHLGTAPPIISNDAVQSVAPRPNEEFSQLPTPDVDVPKQSSTGTWGSKHLVTSNTRSGLHHIQATNPASTYPIAHRVNPGAPTLTHYASTIRTMGSKSSGTPITHNSLQ